MGKQSGAQLTSNQERKDIGNGCQAHGLSRGESGYLGQSFGKSGFLTQGVETAKASDMQPELYQQTRERQILWRACVPAMDAG